MPEYHTFYRLLSHKNIVSSYQCLKLDLTLFFEHFSEKSAFCLTVPGDNSSYYLYAEAAGDEGDDISDGLSYYDLDLKFTEVKNFIDKQVTIKKTFLVAYCTTIWTRSYRGK